MTADTAAPAHSGPEEVLTHRQILAILGALLLGMFLGALDQTVVATAIRSIGDDLHGLSAQAWVTTAFLITSTIATPLYGKLSDIYGRKPFFLLAITVFIVGSALCGLATNMYMLAGFRAVQGLGAGGLFSLALAIMADILSPQERPRYMGYFMATFATSSVAGPVIGGFLSGQDSILGLAGWRWIFWVNVPIGLLALFVVNRVLRLPRRRAQARIDWGGTTAIVAAVVPLLLVAERGREWGWGSPAALACYLIGAAGLVGFFLVERWMDDDALIPLRLFRVQTFSVGSAICLILGAGMFGGLAALPLYLQIVKGASPTEAGLLLLPLMVGVMSSSMISGQRTSRTGRYRQYPIAGCLVLVLAFVLLAFVGADTPIWQTDVCMLLFGIGLGLNMQTIQLAMQNSVEPRDIGVATSSGTFFRQMGGALGTAVFLSILFGSASTKIGDAYTAAEGTAAFRAAAAAHPDQLAQVTSGGSLDDTAFLHTIDTAIAHPFMVGFSDAMSLVFIVGAAVVAVAVILALRLREVPLRTMSGIDAARAEAAKQAAGSQPRADATADITAPVGAPVAAPITAPVAADATAATSQPGVPTEPPVENTPTKA